MIKVARKVLLGMMVLLLATMLSGMAVAGGTVSITGTINEDYQLVDNKGVVYDIADNDAGYEIAEFVGKKVSVTGTVMEEEGSKIITIATYEVIEE
jgi:hypothetical protein